MQTENRNGWLLYHQSVQLVQSFEAYLRHQSERLASHPGYAGRVKSGSAYILAKLQEAVTFARDENARVSGQADLLDF